MASELALRFVLGGAIVSLFAAVGAVCQPKTFAGIFGSAPSVALVALCFASVQGGAALVVTESASMALGAVALLAYCLACVLIAARVQIPIWAGAGAAWLVWAAVALGLWALLHRASVLG